MNVLKPVSAIMTPNPLTVQVDDRLSIVSQLFANNKIHHLPVVDKEMLVGIISKSDFLFFKKGFANTENDKSLEEVRLNNYTAKDIMTSKLAKLEPNDKINVALEIFKENLFHGIPVVDGYKIVGIITTYDIIKHLSIDNEAHASYDSV
jgi:acetoin utilization protein AcuB